MRHMRSLLGTLLALTMGDYNRPGAKPVHFPSVGGHLRHTAPGLGCQTFNAMPRRARRSVWRDALKRNKTTKATLPWHDSGLTLDGQHARVAA